MVTYKKIICVLMIALLSVTQVYAIELESLKESDDYTEVQNAGENICNIVNTLNENNHINIGDINQDKIYKIYVDDSNIFSLSSASKESILESMDYVWSYMDEVGGRDIRVTISQASMPDHGLVENGIITEEKYTDLAEKAGTWTVPEAEIDTSQTLERIVGYLENAGISAADDFILIGGTPKIRSLFAVTFINGQADKIIPLVQTETVVNPDLNSVSRDMDMLPENGKLTAGKSYDFDLLAQAFDLTESEDPESDGGTVDVNASNNENFITLSIVMIAMLFVILLTVKIRKQKTHNH